MPSLIEIRFSNFPDCWDTCGNCADGEVHVVEILVKPGDELLRFDPVLVIETNKTTFEIPTTHRGRVVEVVARVGDAIDERSVLLTLESPESAAA